MRVLISEKLSEHKYKTPEGYLICTDAILARTGKQTYTRDELFGDGDNTEVSVDRPYNEVMNEKTIASFENKPVTFDHPEEDVNIGNYKSYAVGYVRDVRQGKVDGKDVILGNLVITDQDAINAIENGDHTDLSCGYDCDIKDDGNGNYAQNNIRGNHVALCKEGRAGMARIVDSKVKDSKIYMQNQEFNKAFGKDEEYYIILKYGVRIFRHYGRVVIIGSRQALEQLYKDYHLRDYNVTIDDSKVKDAADYSWFKGYINGDLQSFNIDSLISSVKSRRQPLHANLTGKSGSVYSVFIDGSLESNVDEGSNMWIDIVVEYPDRQQKRLVSKDFNSWNECQNIFNTFKNNFRDSAKDSKMRDEFSGIRNGITYWYDNGEYFIRHKNGKVERIDGDTFEKVDDLYKYIDNIKDSIKDENLLGRKVRIRKRYSNLDGTIGTIFSYEGTNYDDEVEVERNGHIYKVDYEDIEFLDSKIKDSLSKKEKELCDYMLENALDDGEDENDLLKKMKVYYSEYSNLARSKSNEVLQYFKSHIDDSKMEDDDESWFEIQLKSALKEHEKEFSSNISPMIANRVAKKYGVKIAYIRNSKEYLYKYTYIINDSKVKDSKEMAMSDAIKMLNVVNAYKKVRDADTDAWIIKNTGLAYEVWNNNKMVKKFPTKKLAVEWIRDRFPVDEITEA